jgi:hypothetical protein
VTSVLVLGAPITAVLDATFKGTLPAALPLAGYGLILVAAAVLLGATLRGARRERLTAQQGTP